MEMIYDGLNRGECSEVESDNWVIYIKIVETMCREDIIQEYHIRKEKYRFTVRKRIQWERSCVT